MSGNHLESLVAEWYELQGYFVRRNVHVGKRSRGGYECELDIVAFNPERKSLVHVEPSLDAAPWAVRETRYAKKFEAGRNHIPLLFKGITIPETIDQVALFVVGGGESRRELAGGRVLFIKEFMNEIRAGLRPYNITNAAIPEQYPLLRTLMYAAEYWF